VTATGWPGLRVPGPDGRRDPVVDVAAERQPQYACDITYGTNNEFGFDYLRDNMKIVGIEDQVQKNLNFAIIDEVDSILIDEARTPLIISGRPKARRTSSCWPIASCGSSREGEHFEIKLKEQQCLLTRGRHREGGEARGVGSFYAKPENMEWPHLIEQCAPRAPHLQASTRTTSSRRTSARVGRGHHRRRVHRTTDGRSSLERRSAPGGRGEGEDDAAGGVADARDDHVPELLPHVREAGRA
jgi:hypothetical protein